MTCKVAIGCVVRDRGWILNEYLQALKRIDYTNKLYIFLENDSKDDTKEILSKITLDGPKLIRSIETGSSYGERELHSADAFANLAYVRNQFVELFLNTDAEYLLSVDSDILVPPNILKRLMPDDKKLIISAAISNIPGAVLDGKINGNFMIQYGPACFIHPPQYPLTGCMDVDVIGSVYLIPRQVLEDGVRYAQHPQGEDIGFCLQAKEGGYRMQVMLDLMCEHRMVPEVNNDIR
jgi:GT2 family glycosyltransferase